MAILITGRAGYIGSYTRISLSAAGHEFVVYDNSSNSSKESIRSVEQIISKNIFFENASGKNISYKIVERRAGDIITCFANPSFAKEVLGWDAKKTIEDMCVDGWKWQSNNPNGYKEEKK